MEKFFVRERVADRIVRLFVLLKRVRFDLRISV